MALYVTHYKQYPIYEPAEGGYYYAGVEMVSSRRAANVGSAIKRLAHLGADYGFTQHNERFYADPDGGRYIGDGEYICIESRKGADVSGWHPYE